MIELALSRFPFSENQASENSDLEDLQGTLSPGKLLFNASTVQKKFKEDKERKWKSIGLSLQGGVRTIGLTRWGVAVQRHSTQEQYRIRGSNRAVPSNSKALSPERKKPSGTPSRTSDPLPAVEEVWFAGCHSDVGGGAVEDTVRYSLADVSLRWMVKQVILSQCGIKFDAAALRRADIDVSTIVLVGPTQPTVEQVWKKKSEAEAGASSQASPGSSGEDGSGECMLRKGKGKDVETQAWPREQDVLADVHDQLKSQPLWWS